VALVAMQGRVRALLARRLRLKRVPTLHFVRDTLDDGEAELEARYAQLEADQPRPPGPRRRRGRHGHRMLGMRAIKAPGTVLSADDLRALDALVLPGRFGSLRTRSGPR
jgi:hypothetical protein